jgi:hypothetical protein
MRRRFWIVAISLASFLSIGAQAQTTKAAKKTKPVDQCYMKPGDMTVIVPLQGGTSSFEPICEPFRIRVNDRKPVTVILKGVSPLEICQTSAKAPTITTVTNPFESIIGSIAGFKSFAFANQALAEYNVQTKVLDDRIKAFEVKPPSPPPAPAKAPPPPPFDPNKDALTQFNDTAKKVYTSAQRVTDKQIKWQKRYQADIDSMVDYLAIPYRGTDYIKFKPDTDPLLAQVRADMTVTSIDVDGPPGPNDPASELDYAGLQALIDEMKATQSRFVTACTTKDLTCDGDTLRTTYNLLDRANALMSVIQDNTKSLQTAQGAVGTSFAVLHKAFEDYDRKSKANFYGMQDGMLTQSIVLPTDYGATDTGTISCSTDTTPAITTTDAINYSILYQNIPVLTASAGLFVTFLQKYEYGVQVMFNNGSVCTDPTLCNPVTPTGTYTQYFEQTDYARASVLPMAFVNVRVAPAKLTRVPGRPNSELAITHNASAGIGINSNTGTNQPEFFGGYAIGFNRLLIHAGLHYGRVESLGGGFKQSQAVPASWGSTATPINWNYQPYVGFGFSVRVAPW